MHEFFFSSFLSPPLASLYSMSAIFCWGCYIHECVLFLVLRLATSDSDDDIYFVRSADRLPLSLAYVMVIGWIVLCQITPYSKS